MLAIVPGSFDPMTLGHRAFIEEVCRRYDKIVVAVMVNDEKKPMFDMETRVKIAKATLEDLPEVEVISDEGMLVDLYRRLGANIVCKGCRNEKDYAYERKMAAWNQARFSAFTTELIPAQGPYADLSSTKIREDLRAGRPLDGIHPNALHLVTEAFEKLSGTV